MSGGETDVRVRPMRPDDFPRVIGIERTLKDAPHWTRPAWRRILDPQAIRQRVAVVAEDSAASAVLGFAVAAVMPPEGELESIAVAPEWQRQGVARRMFGGLADELRRLEVWELFLEMRSSNRAALGFYAALGFAETGQRKGYYANPEEDALLMRLRLG